ncbi:nucleotidyltransferase domain-containing protein [Sphingomonas sp. BK235]|uniref:nucleotidyltransferase family protein n=1 Tax=Sphingomonas sp. BK235 TaxID=2512131 RepID=UPI001044B11B|nr:nucleotidyltransferase domain-containing protein [Sphingomonas sp. BK235]TCP30711.1 nucleotidyltransferase-like protein [Sphingomonas sp. BK235]
MEGGLIPHWSEAIRAWAADTVLVEAVWAFGSRVKGGHRPDSDLDLALIIAGGDNQERTGNAIFLGPRWREELQALLPVVLDLHFMEPDDQVVPPAVRDHGFLIYSSPALSLRSALSAATSR